MLDDCPFADEGVPEATDALEALLVARVAPGRKLYLAQRAVYGIVFLHRPNRADCRACRGCL